MAGNAFTWVEIYVQDLERAKAFYEAVFGFQLEKLESQIPMWAFPSDPGGHGRQCNWAPLAGLSRR